VNDNMFDIPKFEYGLYRNAIRRGILKGIQRVLWKNLSLELLVVYFA